jgi:flagellin-specific chaperone FliS
MLPTQTHPRNADRRAALAGYGTVSLEARVAGAGPHALVQMLYDRLATLLRDAASPAPSDAVRRLRATERALAILDSLDGSLDRRRGGATAAALGEVYALIRARLLARDAFDDAIGAADMLRETWGRIAPGRAIAAAQAADASA